MSKSTLKAGFVCLCAALFFVTATNAQNSNLQALKDAASGLKLRSIGPALMGGRISDIAVSPADRNTWFVSAGSGNLWKTTNAGITWTPVFDDQPSYSIGCVAIDPNNSDVVWVGTGENVSGRHVGWGDGVYRSRDGGKTWENMGLKKSEHIGKILIDPRDGDVVFVAAEGPLWSSGGDRGLFKTTDGGTTWKAVLKIDENTGVTDIEFESGNPEVVYAAAYQRRRHVWGLLAGGPNSGIYKSTDNGDNFRQVKTGLPKGDMGKIGLAVTPADPNLIYAAIEANDEERGFYRSMNKGESWERRNSYISGGTGPHYYQEIEASPVNADLVYQMDVFVHVTRDGGANFNYLGTGREKHSDNHAMWIDPDNGKHMLVGTDAGLYETFDEGTTWRHFPNLPISQFYKLSLDNSEPFYNIVGGAQDLGTLIGPARTMNVEGVRNQDWYVPLGADGHDNAFDPIDPNIVYMEIQQGELQRYDRRSEEALGIKPQPMPGDPPERFNWDSPIMISPHKPTRLYFGSQRLWRSEDRGDSWTAVSGDLTTDKIRYELEMLGRVQSAGALYDNGAMSQYATISCISESPRVEDLLYVGTDDGLIQVSEIGGGEWRKIKNLPGVPALSFINDVEASKHDDNTVFAIADAHKLGDYSPYIFESTDRGASWRSISGDLPEGTIVWMLKQDHENPDLLFIGAEFGMYFSPNRGENWIKLNGAPTISFRDLEIHERDNDLVGATFGRGFYVLDDYTPLRTLAAAVKNNSSTLFAVRDAWWYAPYEPMQAKGKPTLGSDDYTADNPPFGATFTYYLSETPKTTKQAREESEKTLNEKRENVPFPGWDRLRDEAKESGPRVMLIVRDAQNQPVRWVEGTAKKGLHRATWDLRLPAPDPVNLTKPAFQPPWAGDPQGPLAAPGRYNVELIMFAGGELRSLSGPQEFTVKPVPTAAAGTDFNAAAAFQRKTRDLLRRLNGAGEELGRAGNRLRHMKAALLETPKAAPELFKRTDDLNAALTDLRTRLFGDRVRRSFNETTSPSIRARAGRVANSHWSTRQTPTATMRRDLDIAENEFATLKQDVANFLNRLTQLESDLEAAGAPWTPGRRLHR